MKNNSAVLAAPLILLAACGPIRTDKDCFSLTAVDKSSRQISCHAEGIVEEYEPESLVLRSIDRPDRKFIHINEFEIETKFPIRNYVGKRIKIIASVEYMVLDDFLIRDILELQGIE